jgi:hypothetical protein
LKKLIELVTLTFALKERGGGGHRRSADSRMDAWTKAAGSNLGANTRARSPLPEGGLTLASGRGGEGGTRLEAWGLGAGAGEWGGKRPTGVCEGCMRERACEQLAFAHLNLLTFPLAMPAARLHGTGF